MFAETSFSDNETPSATPDMSPAAESPEISGRNDEIGAIAEILNMSVEKIDILINKASCKLPGDESHDMGSDVADISDVIESTGMGRFNRDLDVTTDLTKFPT